MQRVPGRKCTTMTKPRSCVTLPMWGCQYESMSTTKCVPERIPGSWPIWGSVELIDVNHLQLRAYKSSQNNSSIHFSPKEEPASSGGRAIMPSPQGDCENTPKASRSRSPHNQNWREKANGSGLRRGELAARAALVPRQNSPGHMPSPCSHPASCGPPLLTTSWFAVDRISTHEFSDTSRIWRVRLRERGTSAPRV